MKFVLWALVGVAIVIWLMRSKKKVSASDASKADAAAGDAEPMRQCAHCGIHLPASEALVTASGAVYCNEEHRRQHAGS